MKIAIVDTYYPEFLRTLPPITGSYESELRRVLDYSFGTADFYSRNLKAHGWETLDIIANYEPLQVLWNRKKDNMRNITLSQIADFNPDVLFLQDLSFFDATTLARLRGKYLLSGQCSCRFDDDGRLKQFDVIFTSFPHFVDRFRKLGVEAVYLPLAFEPAMLKYQSDVRDIDISFVGGVGRNSHWKRGTDVLEEVAREFGDRFHWYGYGLDNLEGSSPLRGCYRGPAWGADMYRIYGRSKIVVNRHGEVADGWTNNLRCYEAMGMGALLVTEESRNIKQLFPAGVATYETADGLINLLQHLFRNTDFMPTWAKMGQETTLTNHTYAQRMQVVSEVLKSRLVAA